MLLFLFMEAREQGESMEAVAVTPCQSGFMYAYGFSRRILKEGEGDREAEIFRAVVD